MSTPARRAGTNLLASLSLSSSALSASSRHAVISGRRLAPSRGLFRSSQPSRLTAQAASNTSPAQSIARTATASTTPAKRTIPSQSTQTTPPTSKPIPQEAPAKAPVPAANPQTTPAPPLKHLTDGLSDSPSSSSPTSTGAAPDDESGIDWSTSFHGLSSTPFSPEAAAILLQPIDPADVEVKPDGIVYLPEIKYRRILNRAFGPGGWGLAPRGETIVTPKTVTREYGLVVHGRLVSIARGEQQYFDVEGVPTASEGCKSNALMRCCKDLGIASELWDPVFIRGFMKKHARQVFVEHVTTKKRRVIVLRKDVTEVPYPFKEVKN